MPATLAVAAVLVLAWDRGAEGRMLLEAREAARREARRREDACRAASEERALLARELHDVLGHSLGLIVVQAGAAAQLVDDDPAAVRRALGAIRETGVRSLEEMREVLAALRGGSSGVPPGLDELPLLAAGSAAGPLAVEYREQGRRPALSPAAQLSLYRIAQEALANVHRHAEARTARIEVCHTADAVHLVVADDGLGRPVLDVGTRSIERGDAPDRTLRAGGSGIAGMRERVALLGGTVRAGPPADGSGWRVDARVPLGGTR